jgi:hypothetical protein
MNNCRDGGEPNRKLRLGLAVLLTFLAVVVFKFLFTNNQKSTIKILVFTNSLIINDLSLR